MAELLQAWLFCCHPTKTSTCVLLVPSCSG